MQQISALLLISYFLVCDILLRSCQGYVAFIQINLKADAYLGFDLCDNSLKQV